LFRLIGEVKAVNAERLSTPKEKVQELQEKLGYAAKVSKKRRFHALLDVETAETTETCLTECA